jgi:hypothetical protein
VASLGIEQDSAGGVWRTVLRHPDFAKNQAYTVRIGGVTDLFGRGMADTLELKFRTGQ